MSKTANVNMGNVLSIKDLDMTIIIHTLLCVSYSIYTTIHATYPVGTNTYIRPTLFTRLHSHLDYSILKPTLFSNIQVH